MSLIFLTNNEFTLKEINKSKVLTNPIPGFSLVLFYSTECTHCKTLIPIFRKLPGTIGGCQFGVINISKNKDTIKNSMDSTTPLKYVPLIILYHDGSPFMSYKGPRELQSIQRFVVEVAAKIKKERFSAAGSDTSIEQSSIQKRTHEFHRSLNIECIDDSICYFEDVYKK